MAGLTEGGLGGVGSHLLAGLGVEVFAECVGHVEGCWVGLGRFGLFEYVGLV